MQISSARVCFSFWQGWQRYLDTGRSRDWCCQGHVGDAAALLQPRLAASKLGGGAAGTRSLLQAQQLSKL